MSLRRLATNISPYKYVLCKSLSHTLSYCQHLFLSERRTKNFTRGWGPLPRRKGCVESREGRPVLPVRAPTDTAANQDTWCSAPWHPKPAVELLPGSLGLTPCLLVLGHSSHPSGPSRPPSSYPTPPCASASPTLQTAVGASGTCEAELTEGQVSMSSSGNFWDRRTKNWTQHTPEGPFAATPAVSPRVYRCLFSSHTAKPARTWHSQVGGLVCGATGHQEPAKEAWGRLGPRSLHSGSPCRRGTLVTSRNADLHRLTLRLPWPRG